MPEPYYNDWLHLTTHLLWCYDAVLDWPACNARERTESAAWLVREGWAQVEHDGEVWRAEPGQWLVPKPTRRVQTFGEGTHLLSVAFEARWADGSPMLADGLSVVVNAADHPVLERRALSMARTANKVCGGDWDLRRHRVQRPDFLRLDAAISKWLDGLIRVLETHGVPVADPEPMDKHVQDALRVIRNWSWDTPLDRRRLGETVGISPSHLDRLFRHHLGQSPRAYWDRIRVEHACRRLLQPDVRVQEAAHELGFDSLSYFSTWFRKQLGCSPRAFVKEHERELV